jgi:PAS domain-containing protein
VFVSLAPSFAAEWHDCSKEQLIAALKQLGFYAVSETALGADFLPGEIAKQMNDCASSQNNQKLFISSSCPSVVKYIKLYYPKFAPYILNVASPLLAHARLLKKIYGDDIGVVFVGSCIAKKLEADQFSEIDAAITFDELRKWLSRNSIIPNKIENHNSFEFMPKPAGKDSIFSFEDDKLITAVKKHTPFANLVSISCSGFDAIKNALRGFDPSSLNEPVFLSLQACLGGCVNGPGMSSFSLHGANRSLKLLQYAQNAPDTKTEEIVKIKMESALSFPPASKKKHSEEAIRAAFEKIEKYSKHDEIDCGSCGYDTCRYFVEALLAKRAEKTMCVKYMRALSERQASGILQSIPSGIVVVDKNLSIIECNKNFACLFGEEIEEIFNDTEGLRGANLEKITNASEYFNMFFMFGDCEHREFNFTENNKILHLNIFAIEKGETAAGVIDDITTPQIQKNEIIANAKNIIDKNVNVVQQIAFLLGEHAAETESILYTMIKEFNIEGEAK